jgi:hypothetical protein
MSASAPHSARNKTSSDSEFVDDLIPDRTIYHLDLVLMFLARPQAVSPARASTGLRLGFHIWMSIEEIQLLIKNISGSLLPSVPKATARDKIWTVMHSPECDMPFKTFNKHFDALFAEDCYRNISN